jgi:hypothetical protein
MHVVIFVLVQDLVNIENSARIYDTNVSAFIFSPIYGNMFKARTRVLRATDDASTKIVACRYLYAYIYVETVFFLLLTP